MGYHTDFSGSFLLDRPLAPEHLAYLQAFNGTRRMKRDASIAEATPDPVRVAAGLPIGDEGAYFVGSTKNFGQSAEGGVVGYNDPPSEQPGLWCQWVPSDDGSEIVWDEGEKFYNYEEWLDYIIAHFLKPWGYTLNGEVHWYGGDDEDRGTLICKDNVVRAVQDEILGGDEAKELRERVEQYAKLLGRCRDELANMNQQENDGGKLLEEIDAAISVKA